MSSLLRIRWKPIISSQYGHTKYTTPVDLNNLELWRSSKLPMSYELEDTPTKDKLRDLFVTLPTRESHQYPLHHLDNGHHLIFFHPHTRECDLREDSTDPDFGPPWPWTRRMWAGGRIEWGDQPLIIGRRTMCSANVVAVDVKRSYPTKPLVFVRQELRYTMEGLVKPSIIEERTHVYLPAVTAKGHSTTMAKEGGRVFS